MDDEPADLKLPEPTPEERDQSTTEYLQGLKEREALRTTLESTTRELNKVKGQNYDLLKKIDGLENQIHELKAELDTQGKKLSRPNSGKHRKISQARKRPVNRKEPKKAKNGKVKAPVPGKSENEDPFANPDKLYETIAEKFPEMPLSTVMAAERKFAEADENSDGTIDAAELEKILDNSELLFTKQQVMDILSQIDADETGSVDFFECLTVLDHLRANRRTGLPQALQRNKSAVCSIQ